MKKLLLIAVLLLCCTAGIGSYKCVSSVWIHPNRRVNAKENREACTTKLRRLDKGTPFFGGRTQSRGGYFTLGTTEDIEVCNTIVEDKDVISCCITNLCNSNKPPLKFVPGWDDRYLPHKSPAEVY